MSSLVEYYGVFGKSSCGYCKGKKTSESAGMTAHFLSVEDYQDLVDRGWRRSGKYCYKPSNKTTCCPSYTIKCSVEDFVLSKSHKKILKRMNKFLKDGVRPKEDPERRDVTDADEMQAEGVVEKEYMKGAKRDLPELVETGIIDVEQQKADKEEEKKRQDKPIESVDVKGTTVPHEGHSGPSKKKKQMRLERRQAKLAAKGLPMETPANGKNVEKTLEDFLNEEPKDGKHKLKLKLVLSTSKDFKGRHGPKEFELYRKYQSLIHNDEVQGISEFYNFLVDSPLKPMDTQTEHNLGSFHQQYWLDDKLIAVAVLDILPNCVSSVYFFYDPEFSFLSLGTYSSLREVAFTRSLMKDLPELRYYYMGFYIHSCPKMRYKAKLTASFLLCPEAFTWHRITDELLKKLDTAKYSRFNEDSTAKDPDEVTQEDLKRVPMYNDGRPVLFEQYLRKCSDPNVFMQVHEFAKLVGRKCARRFIVHV